VELFVRARRPFDSERKMVLDVHDHSALFRRYVHENYRLIQAFPLENNSRSEELWVFEGRFER
jgi:hypothetical protein